MVAILLADDHNVVRLGLRRLLEADPEFRIIDEVSDARQVLPVVERLRPNLLVLDLMMPGVSFELLQRVAKESPQTRVVVLSTSADETQVFAALRHGAVAYVLKGSDVTQVVQAVRAASSGQHYLSPPLSEPAIAAYVEAASAQTLLAQTWTRNAVTPEETIGLTEWLGGVAYGIAALRACPTPTLGEGETPASRSEVEELKRANRLMSDFVGALSHELRNPLSIIVSSIDLVVEGAFGNLTPEQAEHLGRAAKIAENMTELINAALDLMRAGAGRMAVESRQVDVSELIREIDAATRELRKPEVAFVWHAAPDLSRVYTDPAKLKIVLSNIVMNALKFTEQGSVMLDAHPRDGGIEISIVDTGVGIPAEALPTIFEAFYQGHASPVRRRAGAGLGLYIARRLVEMLGASIAVESEVGRGSIFRVWIPTHPGPSAV